MRQAQVFVVICAGAIAAGALCGGAASADATSNSMGSIPADHMKFLGTYHCDVTLAAFAGAPATTDTGTLTISMAPGNAFREHVDAKDYMSDSYEGYQAKAKTWWITMNDAYGSTSYETSSDHRVYTGTGWTNGQPITLRDTRTVVHGTTLRDTTEIKQNGKWTPFATSVCTKQ